MDTGCEAVGHPILHGECLFEASGVHDAKYWAKILCEVEGALGSHIIANTWRPQPACLVQRLGL